MIMTEYSQIQIGGMREGRSSPTNLDPSGTNCTFVKGKGKEEVYASVETESVTENNPGG